MSKRYKVGVILGRYQPLTLSHAAGIERLFSICDRVVVCIGSADKVNERNPLPIDLRYDIIANHITHNRLNGKYRPETKAHILRLRDWTDEADTNTEFGDHLYYNIYNTTGDKDFMILSAEIDSVAKWFSEDKLKHIEFLQGYRVDNISATHVRKAFMENDISFLEEALPEDLFKNAYLMHRIYATLYETTSVGGVNV